ncbi:MAG: hypothetical protein FJW29_06135 [Acidobacteria bacterium]|nr:hypothetical protein [Acidobacteriota bacterium]
MKAMTGVRPVGLVLIGLTVVGCDIRTDTGGEWAMTIANREAQDVWTRSVPLLPGGRLILENVNGAVAVEATTGTALEMTARRVAKSSSEASAREQLDRVTITEAASATEVRVVVQYPRFNGLNTVEVEWEVKVPSGVAVDITNTNGSLRLTGLDAPVSGRTSNGRIQAEALTSPSVDVETTNGRVFIDYARPLVDTDQVMINSTNGGVTLTVPEASRLSLSADLTNGEFDVADLPVQRAGTSSRQHFEGTLNGGGARVGMSTTNGSVHLSKQKS